MSNDDRRESLVQAVMNATASLASKQHIEPEIVLEGAVKGAAAALVSAGTTLPEVAELLRDMANAFEVAEGPKMN